MLVLFFSEKLYVEDVFEYWGYLSDPEASVIHTFNVLV